MLNRKLTDLCAAVRAEHRIPPDLREHLASVLEDYAGQAEALLRGVPADLADPARARCGRLATWGASA